MQHSALLVPFSLVLLGLGSAACGQAADATGQPDTAPVSDAGAGTDPVRGWGHDRGATQLNLPPFSDDGQGGASAVATPPAAPSAAVAPDRAATAPADATPPRIVSVQPANGAAGVRADAPIVIEFSEPMDQLATRDAFASETLPRVETGWSWNEAGTVLTLQPRSLSYAHATLEDDEPLELQSKTYGYTLTRFATDLAGNALAKTTVQFSTLRQVTHTLTPVAARTGAVRDVSLGSDHPRLYGFLTFDAAVLPAGVLKLERAVAELGPHSLNQPVPVYDVSFDQLSAAPTGAAPGAQIGAFPSGVSGALLLPEPACALLIKAYLNRTSAHHYAQFRLDLPATLGDRDVDLALVNQALGQTSLVADYLLP